MIALFWDGSYFFGLFAFWQLKKLNIPFSLVTAKEVKTGELRKYRLLLVPGGWTGPKNEALGEEGREEIKRFVREGGNYIGICGGAGLGLSESDGLCLLPVKRKKFRELANFFGKIRLKQIPHPLWRGISAKACFNVWWPGLFEIIEKDNLKILAFYNDISSDFYVTDLNINDIKTYNNLGKWENYYQIKIDPKCLKGEPAILEGKYGEGNVILSYPHLDTPNNHWEALAFLNLYNLFFKKPFFVKCIPLPNYGQTPKYALKIIKKLKIAIKDLISFGQRQFLWYWVTPWMLRWRKGVRGFHYLTLYLLIKEIERLMKKLSCPIPSDEIIYSLEKTLKICIPFLEKAKYLLLKERYLLGKQPLNLISVDDEEIADLRKELFGHTPAYGGELKRILQLIDNILVPYLKAEIISQYKTD
ncbi:MAG: BPL-N domain-containing protein [Candidatus Desulfofervidus auxilii]|nr:BPL-N domain-containing protein [Candidatus Desulfofervidus auxilii]